MLKKKVAAVIVAATRTCSKCGRLVSLSTTGNKTICECGAVVYDVNNNDNINGETTHAEAEFEAGDSSTESTDSK